MHRLKIVEQIIIVLILAVFIPFVTIGFIISNISQQSVRSELANSTYLIARFVGNSYEKYINLSQSQLNQMATGFNFIYDNMQKVKYFSEIESKTKLFKNLDIIENSNIKNKEYKFHDGYLTLVSSIDKKYSLKADININIASSLLSDDTLKGRNIYVIDNETKNIIATNDKKIDKDVILAEFNTINNISNKGNTGIFGNKKNTPMAYYKLDNLNWTIIVDTTKKVTSNTITKARYRIILSLILAAISIIVIVGFYTYYLYINIRQLFKGITAISKGNYDKKIHLIKSPFTPNETVFIAKEFNYMANKIKLSYKDLKEKNKKLEKLNQFRENLVSATSHEFRTPLTSIIGYASRLLRKDIVIDKEMETKSLQIIKQQAQRLSNMVEDLLVIPELDSFSLKLNIQEIDLIDALNRAVEYLTIETSTFNTDIKKDLKYVWADDYRLEQILINLLDNAIKYNIDNEKILVKAYNKEDGKPVVQISNKCEKIPDEIKSKLFEKFTRVDSQLTRTTRGTGLGLYIVKGLVENMRIDLDLKVDDYFTITLSFNDYVE